MGILFKENINSECTLGIWNITESYSELYSKVVLQDEEIKTLDSFGSDARKIEWLSVRVLLRELTGKELTIIYNGNRKPFIKGNSYQISISHSNNLTAVLISKDKKVGLDLEFMSGKISKVADKFINDKESITTNPELQKYHLYLHWCAKEAMYKICDKQDINFRDGLTIYPFRPDEHGFMKGHILNGNGEEDIELEYLQHENYALVWCVK